MRRILLVLFVLNIFNSQAQKYWDLGVFIGGSSYLGDINPNNLIDFKGVHSAYGVSLRKSFSSRWSLKGSFVFGTVSADDKDSDDTFQLNRNLNFRSDIYEFSSQIEFNFLEFNPYKNPRLSKKPEFFSPYVFIGLGVFRFNPTAELSGNRYALRDYNTEGAGYSLTSVSIPFGLGIKYRLSRRVFLEISFGMRRTFTDYLDDVSDKYPTDLSEMSKTALDLSDRSVAPISGNGTNWGSQRGNPDSNDYYSFFGLHISYNLTQDPNRCYFDGKK